MEYHGVSYIWHTVWRYDTRYGTRHEEEGIPPVEVCLTGQEWEETRELGKRWDSALGAGTGGWRVG